MPWKTMEIREQRVRFVVTASRREKSMAELCREFGISRPVGYEWLRRYQQGGVGAIAERSRRPSHSPQRKPPDIDERVIEWRRRYPDWGARKLRVVLEREGVVLARNTIHRILLRHDLIHPEDRHDRATTRFERSAANELWQMDFKGPKLWHQPVGPLSVIDDHSRFVVVLQAAGSTRMEAVKEPLIKVFSECGLPSEMLMDHGTPWWNPQTTGGMTQLSLWLMRQGIDLHFSRIRHPQTQGKVERFHGELQRALARRRVLVPDIQGWLDEFRWEHNYIRPHESLNMATPATRWSPSPRRYDPHPPRWEYPTNARVLKVDSAGKIRLQGKHWKISVALGGEWVRLEEIESRINVYYCTTLVREIDTKIQRSTMVERWISLFNEV